MDDLESCPPSSRPDKVLTKICRECGISRSLANFSKKGKNSYRSYCKTCNNNICRSKKLSKTSRLIVEDIPVEIEVEEKQTGEWVSVLLSLMKDRGIISNSSKAEEEIDIDVLLKRGSSLNEFVN
ncbi:MAG: hypothetical protein AB7T49_00345 [Oligoflexales bacterium]